MPDSTLALLPAASALDGTELYYSVQGGVDTKVTGAQIRTLTGGLQSVSTTVTSAQILNSASVPIQIIPAPGVGKSIQLISCATSLGGTTDYTINWAITLIYGSVYTGAVVAVGDDIGKFAGHVRLTAIFSNSTSKSDDVKSKFENQPIYLSGGTANPTLGDGDMKLTVTYTVVNV